MAKRQGNLRETIERMRSAGEGNDKILAHINPMEAQQLASQYGYNINPVTGLPQFGWIANVLGKKKTDPHTGEQHRTGLRGMLHANKLEKAIRPVGKIGLPLVGSMVGSLFGGPMGSLIGGSIGGALSSNKHPLDHALGGAAVGLGSSFLFPKLGGMMGLEEGSTMGKMMGMGAPSLTSQFGGLFGGASNAQNAAAVAQAAQAQGTQSSPQDLSKKDLFDAALLGTTVLGVLGARTKTPTEMSMKEMMEISRPKWGPEHDVKRHKPLKRKYIQPTPEQLAMVGSPEYQYFEDVNAPMEYYARGGYVRGRSGGQTDDVPINLPEGSYVMDATTVSLIGDGNSEHGAEKIKEFLNKKAKEYSGNYEKTGIVRKRTYGRNIRAKVSNGEYIVLPHEVEAIGKGINSQGAKIFDRMRNNLRKQKGVKVFLPPKSKPLTSYVR